MFDRITRAKVLLPDRRPNLFSRPRLLNLFKELLPAKLILVIAPAGYGKTSFLVDMAHSLVLPVCWYALDALDRDPGCFLAHFVVAIGLRFSEFGQRSAAVLDQMMGPTFDLDEGLTTIVAEIEDRIREDFVLVLDDYHLVSHQPQIRVFINRFVQRVGDQCHLVIAADQLVSLPDLVLMAARSQVGGLGLTELAFQADEIQALVWQNYHLTLPRDVVEKLAQDTEGRLTDPLLAAQSIWPGMTDRLWRTYIEAKLELADSCLLVGAYEVALSYCQQILALDPGQEEAHRQAMRAHAALGNRAAVIGQFEQCQQALQEVHQASVSLETRRLYETLVR